MNVLQVGAIHRAFASSPSPDWRSMDSAPRDGTVVELMCTYGVAPWYGLFQWTETYGQFGWHRAGNPSSGVTDEHYLKWRPFVGEVAAYVDPTGGMQDNMAYWRGATAAKHGLPLNTFERPGVPDRVVAAQEDSADVPWYALAIIAVALIAFLIFAAY